MGDSEFEDDSTVRYAVSNYQWFKASIEEPVKTGFLVQLPNEHIVFWALMKNQLRNLDYLYRICWEDMLGKDMFFERISESKFTSKTAILECFYQMFEILDNMKHIFPEIESCVKMFPNIENVL